jgi:hypothetical protein
MGVEIAALGAAKVALVAGKRLLARVRLLMDAESAALGAAIVALVAGKQILKREALALFIILRRTRGLSIRGLSKLVCRPIKAPKLGFLKICHADVGHR